MSFRDLEVGIPESPIRTKDIMLELMTASTAMSTAKCLTSAHSKIRSVMFGAWMINILTIMPFFIYAILRDSQGDLIGLGMVVIPLYISKIIESLNKISDKTSKVYSESEYIKMRLIEISEECETQRRKCPGGEVSQSAGKHIMNLSRGILADLTTLNKETQLSCLIIDSILWKSPRYTKYLDKSFVNDKTTIIKSILKCE
jgi:hypothetical protein